MPIIVQDEGDSRLNNLHAQSGMKWRVMIVVLA